MQQGVWAAALKGIDLVAIEAPGSGTWLQPARPLAKRSVSCACLLCGEARRTHDNSRSAAAGKTLAYLLPALLAAQTLGPAAGATSPPPPCRLPNHAPLAGSAAGRTMLQVILSPRGSRVPPAGDAALPAPRAVVFVPSRELSLQVQKARFLTTVHRLPNCDLPPCQHAPSAARANRGGACAPTQYRA